VRQASGAVKGKSEAISVKKRIDTLLLTFPTRIWQRENIWKNKWNEVIEQN
jgi:hypothetical protein